MASKNEEKIYETVFHLIPSKDKEEAEKVFEWIKGAVATKGEIISEESPTLLDLSYTVRHRIRKSDGSYSRYDQAYFGSVKFKALREAVNDLGREIKGNESVLRVLTIETVKEDTRIGDTLPGTEEEGEEGKAAENKAENKKVKEEVSDDKKETDNEETTETTENTDEDKKQEN